MNGIVQLEQRLALTLALSPRRGNPFAPFEIYWRSGISPKLAEVPPSSSEGGPG